MTTELYAYILLCLFCLSNVFFDYKNKNFLFLFLVIYSIYVFSVRFSGFDIDMLVYADALEYDTLSIYYVKEPLYWLTSRYIFNIIKIHEYVFIFYDYLIFFVLLMVRRSYRVENYLIVLWLCFFPSVMGMQNVFRQYISSVFILWFYLSCIQGESFSKKIMLLLVSSLFHNVALVFLPLVFIKERGLKYNWFFSFVVIFVIVSLPVALGTKSSSSTGELNPIVYLAVFMIMFLAYSFLCKFKFTRHNINYFLSYIYFSIILTFCIIFMGDAQSKRVGMIVLTLSLIPLAQSLNFLSKSRWVDFFYSLILILPTLIFSSSRDMLLTEVLLK
nr:putative O-antigen polymerase [Vibrio mimicus]